MFTYNCAPDTSAIVDPFSNLLHLTLAALPITSEHLPMLQSACPKLISLTIRGKPDEDDLFRHFAMTTFPLRWPSQTTVSFKHAYVWIVFDK
jgi:hypothetical protein